MYDFSGYPVTLSLPYFRYDFRGAAQGLSITGGICSSDRVSVIEYEGIKVIVQISAHEMGHKYVVFAEKLRNT